MRWPVILIGGILFAAVLIFAFFYGLPNSPQVSTTNGSTTTDTNSPSVLYANAQYGFSINHPVAASTTETGFDGFLSVTNNPVIGIALPLNEFPGTNLAEAGVYVGVSTDKDAVNACPSPADTERSLGTKIISNNVFQVFASTGAAAGNLYDKTAYRSVRNGNCYEIVELMHSGNIGNYPTGSVKQFDPGAVRSKLDAIVNTFSFTGQSGSGVEGKVQITCPSDATGVDCKNQIFTIEAYQGPSPIALFKTSTDGIFNAQLPPGKYELRVDTASTTHCASVGVVITENTFISTNISCDASIQE